MTIASSKRVYLTYNKNSKEEFTILVTGYANPPEPQTYDYPGSEGSFEIDNVELTSGSVFDLIMEGLTIESIEEKCLEELDLDNEYYEYRRTGKRSMFDDHDYEEQAGK